MGIHILIIEAESRFRKNLYKYLQSEDFVVDKITPLDDVETIVLKERIDVVLLGLDGLGREGLALIRPIKKAGPRVEVIVINDANQMDLSIEAMELGAYNDFLVPLDIKSLALCIREAVSNRK